MKLNTKDVDINLLRKKKKKRRQLVKLLALMLFVGLAVTLYVKRDLWIPRLEGIGTKFQSVKSGDGLAGGNFPLRISGGIDYQTRNLNGSLAILSDAYLYIYSDDGDLYEERQHAYSNAMLQTAGKKALIYESGGSRMRVENKSRVLFNKKLDDNIIFARISENGNVAVITDSDVYICRMIVFDESGKEIYSRNCVERVTDMTFTEDGSGGIISTIDAIDGNICSKLISVSFKSETDNWTSDFVDTMSIRMYASGSDIFMLGDTSCIYFDGTGKVKYEYEYPAELKDWDFSNGKAALLFENETKRHSYLVMLRNNSQTPYVKEFADNNARCIELIDDHICVMGRNGIVRYDYDGGGEKIISEESSYENMIYINNYIFLLGYDRIDRIDYR